MSSSLFACARIERRTARLLTALVAAAVVLMLALAGSAHAASTASISGTVSDAQGKAIKTGDICISAETQDFSHYGYAQSTSDGTYTISNLAAGTYNISYSDCYDSDRNDAPASRTETVNDGQAKTGVDQELPAGTTISGHVYGGGGTGTPLESVCVEAYVPGPNESYNGVSYASTDVNGAYTLKHLDPSGSGYKVQFTPCTSDLSSYVSEYYDGASNYQDATTLNPTVADPSTGIDAHLQKGASISGTVHDANGDAITSADVCVDVNSQDFNGSYGYATSDDHGHYKVTGLQAGSYYVYFSDCSNSDRNDVGVYYGDVQSQNDSTLVVLSAGGQKAGIDADLPAGSAISGAVYRGTGKTHPLAGICVEAMPADYESDTSGDYGYATTGSDGTYSVRHLPERDGGYHVMFQDCSPSRTYVSQYYGGDYSSTDTAVNPTTDNPSTGIDAHLEVGGAIKGTVKDDAGHTITTQDICINTYRSAASDGSTDNKYYSAYATSASDGSYSLAGLPSGQYSVTFSDCGYTPFNGTPRNDRPETIGPITVSPPDTTDGQDASMQPGTSISGHVYGGGGTDTKLSGICVSAYDTSQMYSPGSYATTDNDGAYTLMHLDPTHGYKVQFSTCWGNSQYSSQYYDGVSDYDSASVLHPTLENPSTGIDAHLSDGAPVTTITGGPAANAATSATSESITFTADAEGATFQCALDSTEFSDCSSPYDTDTLTPGRHTFKVFATANGRTQTVPTTLTWTVDPSSPTETSQGQVPDGGTFSSDPDTDPSESNPVTAQVTLPTSGKVTLTKEPTTTPSTNGYSVLGRQIDIAADASDGSGPIVATESDPIHLSFSIAASEIPPSTDINSLTVMRNGSPAADCSGAPGHATPDPCVESRTVLPDGGIQIDLLTTHCSTWNVAVHQATPPAPPTDSGTPPTSQTPVPASHTSSTTNGGGSSGAATAPKLSVGSFGKLKLAKTLKSGLAIPLSCAAGCTVKITAQVPGKVAKRLGLSKKRKTTTVASGSSSVSAAVTKVRAKFTKKAKSAFKHQKKVKLSLTLTASPLGGGPSSTTHRTITLKK